MPSILKHKSWLGKIEGGAVQAPRQRMANSKATENKAKKSVSQAGGYGVCCVILLFLTILTAFFFLFISFSNYFPLFLLS